MGFPSRLTEWSDLNPKRKTRRHCRVGSSDFYQVIWVNQLDGLYIELLRLGLLLLRQSIDSGNLDWSRQEVEHLHEVPALIGDSNPIHHCGYWNWSQGPYREWVSAQDSDVQDSILAFYETVWTKMKPVMDELLHRIENQDSDFQC